MRPLAVVALLALAAGPLAGQRARGVTVTQAAEVAILADCASTQWFLARGYRETNPFLGRSPSPVRLWATCAATGAGLALLPRKVRRPVALLVVTVQVFNVVWNLYQGGRAVR